MDKLEILKQEVLNCKKCDLYKERKNTVFGDGNTNADIMLISERSGYYEDLKSITFIGKQGQLLNKILGASGFNRKEHVFITNIVKCRPTNNRDPFLEEREACLPYLHQQIEIIDRYRELVNPDHFAEHY
ncbi:MAG: uracil-DNA glycosylase [Salinivirgaceae bacterium]|nr:uracil-DNA glycosylase [Salinivirgaceae bacterium]